MWFNLLMRFQIPVSRKLSSDLIWNVASFAFMGVAGLLINILIAHRFGAAALGAFNQVYSIYMLLSQFAAGGIHLSVLKHVAQFAHDPRQVHRVFSAGLILAMALAGVVTLLARFGQDAVGNILNSRAVAVGLGHALPGLCLFTFNKTCMALINGRRKMKVYAVFQGLRVLFMLAGLLVLIRISAEANELPRLLLWAEAALSLFVLVYSARLIRFRLADIDLGWIRKHLAFGVKAIGGNILIDINARVDVLILGCFASDSSVGVYSFAAMLADGFVQLPVAVRANLNPLMTQTLFCRGTRELQHTICRGVRLSYRFLGPLVLLAVAVFPVINILNSEPAFVDSWGLFAILMTGVLLAVGYLPVLTMLGQTGHPGHQSILFACIVGTNVTLNLILVPIWGMYGAALAAAATAALQVVYVKALAYHAIGIRI